MRKRYARHNVVAEFADEVHALRALESLQEAGFDKHETSLLTPRREKRPGAKRAVPFRPRVGSGVGWGLALGTMVGAVAGIIVVVPVAVAVVAVFGGDWTGSAAIIATVAGAGAGATVGALMGIEAAGRKSAMWSMSLAPRIHRIRDGISLVAVHSDDQERAAGGADVLHGQDAVEIHHHDAEASFSPPAHFAANLGDNVPSDAAEAPGAWDLSGSTSSRSSG